MQYGTHRSRSSRRNRSRSRNRNKNRSNIKEDIDSKYDALYTDARDTAWEDNDTIWERYIGIFHDYRKKSTNGAPSRTLPARGQQGVQPRKFLGQNFDLNSLINRKLYRKSLGDHKFRYLVHPNKSVSHRGDLTLQWDTSTNPISFYRPTFQIAPFEQGLLLNSIRKGIPVVGLIDLNFGNAGHLIAYMIRESTERKYQLFIIEPYDTDILDTVKSTPQWRDLIVQAFAGEFGETEGIYPTKGEPLDLTKGNAGPGHCAMWGVTILDQITNYDLQRITEGGIRIILERIQRNPSCAVMGGRR